jgi:hypothetical protein
VGDGEYQEEEEMVGGNRWGRGWGGGEWDREGWVRRKERGREGKGEVEGRRRGRRKEKGKGVETCIYWSISTVALILRNKHMHWWASLTQNLTS